MVNPQQVLVDFVVIQNGLEVSDEVKEKSRKAQVLEPGNRGNNLPINRRGVHTAEGPLRQDVLQLTLTRHL